MVALHEKVGNGILHRFGNESLADLAVVGPSLLGTIDLSEPLQTVVPQVIYNDGHASNASESKG